MKKLIALIALVFLCGSYASAQITLEHTFSDPTAMNAVLFSGAGTKLVATDTNSIELYNTDYSFWKTINIPMYAGYRVYLVQHISDKLFNTDDQVEAYVSWWSAPSTPYAFRSAIINESGAIIHDFGVDHSTANVFYINGAYKLFVGANAPYRTEAYSLPGELPCGHCGAGSVGVPRTAGASGAAPMAYPNPASGDVTIRHGLSAGVSGTVNIIGADGRSFGIWQVSGAQPELNVNINTFPTGFYTFSVQADGLQPAYGSFVK